MVQNELTRKTSGLVVGIGSALVDILSWEEEDFLKETGAAKGGMTLVDDRFIESTLLKTRGRSFIVPGGSACNTAIGISKLGGTSRFIGKLGNDEFGKLFATDLQKHNVDPALIQCDSPTGRVLSIITPDAERSMFTFLGAASETRPHDLRHDFFKDAAVVHIEGYLLFNKELMFAALESARAAGAQISLDLASYTVVEESRETLDQIVDEYVDILIANEDEARAFTGFGDESRALKALAGRSRIVALKVGRRGSYISSNGETVRVEPAGSEGVVDTTGAGDLWASGFLYGLVNGYSLEVCGRIGSVCGYEVCRDVGASISESRWQKIRDLLETWNQIG